MSQAPGRLELTRGTAGRRAPGEPSTRGLAPPCPACMAPVAPLFHPLPSYADAAGSSLHQRGEPRTRIRAISGPLASVHSGQLQPSGSNEPPSSAHLAAMINTPSKLVMRVRFPSPALIIPGQVRDAFPVTSSHLTETSTRSVCHTRATETAGVIGIARRVSGLLLLSPGRSVPPGRTCSEPLRSPSRRHPVFFHDQGLRLATQFRLDVGQLTRHDLADLTVAILDHLLAHA